MFVYVYMCVYVCGGVEVCFFFVAGGCVVRYGGMWRKGVVNESECVCMCVRDEERKRNVEVGIKTDMGLDLLCIVVECDHDAVVWATNT